jgi:hypothetical protein
VGLLFGPSAAGDLLASQSPLTWLPSILYMVGLYFVIRRGRVPQWCWGPLALAAIQLAVPVSYVYTTAWAAVAAVCYASGHLIDIGAGAPTRRDADYVLLRILLLLALTATLAPSIFTISGVGDFEVSLTTFVSPVLVLITLCVAIGQSVRSDPVTVLPELEDHESP